MTAAPPPSPAWTVTSVVERSYLVARDNFAAFITISLVFNAISLVVDLLDLGPLFGRLLLLGLVQYLAIGLSAILVIPPFFLLPLWAVTIPAMMVESLELGAAFARSADLTRYRRVPILLTFLLVAVILIAGSLVIFFLLGNSALAQLVVWVYGSVAATVLQPLPAIFYVLLREEKEGMTAAQITAPIE